MKRILEIDPLERPKCTATMRIVAFIQDSKEISKIMLSLKIPQPIIPDTIPRAPPSSDDLYFQD